ncbi:uncharacterized protein LOC108827094 [Raphanus sativus]|uniref:Uncharacterized protein LOC108827094 n=1 Tax=Raphanus sativus TaxID=3726 RepID=A0A9W3CFM8_RAPSA|nr:uncharacterized protein LOC108827094 [Raphanus sativus]
MSVDSKPLPMVSIRSDEEDYFVRTPQKTISEILETTKVERCFLRCTIAAIDSDLGLHYMSCKGCGTKIDMLHNNLCAEGTYELDRRFMFYCTKCKVLNPKRSLRPKLHLVVLDDTGHTKLLVLDSIALQLLHQPFSHAMTPIKDNGDTSVLRTALTKLVGKTYLFKIIIDRNNYQYKDDTFKVAKIITSPCMMNEFDVSPYPKGCSNTFSPEFYKVSQTPEHAMLVPGSSYRSSKCKIMTPAKREVSPIESLEASAYLSADTKPGASFWIKKEKH